MDQEPPRLPTDLNAPAHPAARIVTEYSNVALDRQIGQLNALDAKASYLGAAIFVLIAGFLTAVATKPPFDERLQDLTGLTLFIAFSALVAIGYTWWPRKLDVPPHPKGLRVHHWMDTEEETLRAISDQIAITFDDHKAVENKKVWGIKIALICLAIATVFGSAELLITLSAGGH